MSYFDPDPVVPLATARARSVFDHQCQELLKLNCKFCIVRQHVYADMSARHDLPSGVLDVAYSAMKGAESRGGFRRLCDIADTRVYVHRATQEGALTLMPLVAIAKSAHDARRVTRDDERDIFAFAIKAFLNELKDSTTREQADRSFAERDDAYFLTWAASRLMIRAAHAAGCFAPDFFDTINKIALSAYEGEGAQGLLLVRPREQRCSVSFPTTVPLRDRRRARKLLAACSAEFCAVTNGEDIFGYEPSPDSTLGFQVRFQGRQDWSLMGDGECLLRVVRGLPELPRAGSHTTELKAKLEAVFDESVVVQGDRLQRLVDTVSNAMHGSVIVILETPDECMQEAERLGATLVEAFELTDCAANHVTRIDGALIVDGSARCYAIGAILDGAAVPHNEDRARGSRYNSAMRYAIGRKRSLVVVASEDGGVDILP